MLKYIDKDEYLELLEVSSISDNFNQLVIEASNYINSRTFNRIDKDNVSEQVKYVTCLIINLIDNAENQKKEMGNLKSQNIEGWSETYKTDDEINIELEREKYKTLKMYLSQEIGVDRQLLLYRGVC